MRVRGTLARRTSTCLLTAAAVVLGAAACTGGDSLTVGPALRAGSRPGASLPSPNPTPQGSLSASTPTPQSTAVAPLKQRLRPDILVISPTSLTNAQTGAVRALPGVLGVAVLDVGVVQVYGAPVPVLGVDPSEFRAFAPQGTAEDDGVWQAIARGDAVMAHADAKRFNVPLGSTLQVVNPNTGTRQAAVALRIGAFATTIPGGDLLVSHARAADLGLAAVTGLVIATSHDPAATAAQVRTIVGQVPTVDLLAQPATSPTAYLTRSISLHTWGIAIDLNVAENPQHTHGSIDPRVVALFKKWGFRWGGDWSDPDPMHFELGALLTT